MNIQEIKTIVASAYVPSDQDDSIPKYSTQFSFSERGVIIRIPIYEYRKMPPELLSLICLVVSKVNPNIKGEQTVKDMLILAATGGQESDVGFIVKGLVEETSSARGTACAVSACVFALDFNDKLSGY